MANRKTNCKINTELEKAILKEKTKGTPDIEIGNKYGVNFIGATENSKNGVADLGLRQTYYENLSFHN
jgi:hypothetical protein